MKKIIGAVLLLVVVMTSGCASVLWNQHAQAKNAAIRGVALQGGGAGIGVSLFDLGSLQTAGDWAGQIGAAVVDGVAAYAAYEATKGSGGSDNAAPVTLPAITTGNNSPVLVNVSGGNGAANQHNPNVTTTSSTAARRH